MTVLDDPLLSCLAFIAKLKGCPVSKDAIRANVPLTGDRFTPDMFVQAAEIMGFSAVHKEEPLDQIPPLTLPVVLLLKNDKACVLIKVNHQDKTAEIALPEAEEGVETVSLSEIEKEYEGSVLFIKSKYHFDARTEEKKFFAPTKSWFWDTFWRFKYLYTRVIVGSIFINLFVLAIPLFIMNVYDRVVPNKAIETLWVLAIGVIIVLVCDFILKILRAYFVDAAGKKADILISTALLEHSLNSVMESQPASIGVRANHMKEFEFVREFFSSASVATLVDLPFVFLFIMVIEFIGGPLFIIPLLGVVFVITATVLLSIPLYEAVKKSYLGGAQKNAILVESLSGIEEIKSSYAHSSFLGKWLRFSTLASESLLKARFFSNLTTTISVYSVSIGMVCVVIWGVYLIGSGDLTVGGLIACTILTNRAMAPLAQITTLLTRYQQARCSLKALNDIMETPVERPHDKRFMYREKFDGAIEFDRVSFHYPEQKTDFFKEISFTIQAGEHVAILGSLGSGKSTLLKLIDSLYLPKEGNIRIDGIDIHQIDPVDLRRNIGFLSQDPKLFFGTARTNISLKAPWVDDASVLEAAKLSGAVQFINIHPEGFQMPIGENGKGLSGGQKQTIALARALLLNPPILLFDEPTSSMDNYTENYFVEQMKQYFQGKTAFIVTHKQSLLQLVDRILILQQGKIVVDGPRDQVLNEIAKGQKEQEKNG